MNVAVAVLSIVLGLVYFSWGAMTLVEFRRNWRQFGFSHFGAAWIAMTLACGPHHLVHGVHILFEGRQAGVVDLIALGVGAPAGVIWFLLRIEAFTGGSGDRFVAGTPAWLMAVPVFAGVYVGALGAAAVELGGYDSANLAAALPGFAIAAIASVIGVYLVRTQLANRHPLGGWSVSGLALAFVFPSCGAMHAVHSLYILNGQYAFDIHGAVIDWFTVPAGLYFLWVVQALFRGSFRDWNGVPKKLRAAAGEVEAALALAAREAA
jgi:hypothetical protein